MQHLSESTSVIQSVPRPRRRPHLRVLSRAPSDAPGPSDAADPPEQHAPTLETAAPPRLDRPTPPALDPLTALDRLYTAPFGFVLHPLVNQRARCVPLVLDHPADLAVVSRALELVAAEGGFDARIRRVWQVEARIRLSAAPAATEVMARLRDQTDELLQIATPAIPACARGDVPLALELSSPAPDEVRLRLHLETVTSDDERLEAGLHDAARAIAPLLIDVAGVRPSVRVSRVSSERAQVSCRIGRERLLASALSFAGLDGQRSAEQAVARAAAALAAGEADAAIATAHNALIERGIAAVALALGNAPARVARGLEQHAARRGGCAPLCRWRLRDDAIEGELELPIELATHGRWQLSEIDPDASLALDAARDIALLAACIGMAASLIALEDAVRARALERRRPLPPPRRRRRATPARAEPVARASRPAS
jgi:hypothetical protein